MATSFRYFVTLASGETMDTEDGERIEVVSGALLIRRKEGGAVLGFAPGEWLQFYWGKAPDGPDAD